MSGVQESLFVSVFGGSAIAWVNTIYRMYFLKRYSRKRAQTILSIHSPTDGKVTIKEIVDLNVNQTVLNLYHYWILLSEYATHIFVFGSIIVFFFSALPVLCDKVDYDASTLIIYSLIQISLLGIFWFSRLICSFLSSKINIDLKELW